MEDWNQPQDESSVESGYSQYDTADHLLNDPAPGLYDDVLRVREQQSNLGSRGGSSERLYEESERYRQQQVREPQAHHPKRQTKEVGSLTFDDMLRQLAWREVRAREAAVAIRAATGKNDWLDLGTEETLLNDSLAGLTPDERSRADKIYRDKNNTPIRADILAEQSGKQLAISLSLLHWPNSEGIKAREFWDSWGNVFGLSDNGITALGLMNSDEIRVLKDAYEDSYGGRDFASDLSNNNSEDYTFALMSVLLQGKDRHTSEGWLTLASILTKAGKIDAFVSIMHEAPQLAQSLVANDPVIRRSIREQETVFNATRILDELSR